MDRVAVHIVEFLKALLIAPNVHVVEPSLPDAIVRVVMNRGRQGEPIQHPVAPSIMQVAAKILENELGGALF